MSQGGGQDPGYGNGYGDDYAEDDDYYTYDATDEEDEGRRRPIVILAIVTLIFVFAGVIFLAYKQGLRQGSSGNPPIIRADGSPTKVAPTNPGGIDIPHQDRAVYDRLSGSGDPTGDDTEHLLPKAEEPMAMTTPEAATPPADAMAPTTAAPTAPVEQAPSATTSNQSAMAAPQTVTVQPAPVTAAPPAEAAPATTSAPTSATTTSAAGGYVVQLAAFRDEPSALAAFKKLQKKYPSLAPLRPDVQRADLGAKGIYYRLRAGYVSKSDAQTLCTELSGKGQACFVRTK